MSAPTSHLSSASGMMAVNICQGVGNSLAAAATFSSTIASLANIGGVASVTISIISVRMQAPLRLPGSQLLVSRWLAPTQAANDMSIAEMLIDRNRPQRVVRDESLSQNVARVGRPGSTTSTLPPASSASAQRAANASASGSEYMQSQAMMMSAVGKGLFSS
eukprot:CAMPEP_0115831646 /NCGR_PEP_ID=MMETSP0287-20121206/2246_1 /TAXON_ID=412157 /ORGANISM="Chrysochromulina rotalis, Strain UIO044" /LENGTH=161 /DNA_ID=CAMNT_0003284999 /DNA_START=25 /DNA_END=510 /DNA_ORIENTATION=-